MTISNHFINARIAAAMGESNLRPLPDYLGNDEDGKRFVDAADELLKDEELNPEAGSMLDVLLEHQGPVLYRVTLLGLVR